jgi:hypothetical protein
MSSHSHRNLHHLLGIENMDTMPHPGVMGLVGHNGHGIRPMGPQSTLVMGQPIGFGLAPHHAHIVALGMGLGYGLTAGGGSGGGGGDIGGSGLYVTPHGGKLSKIGQAFNKAFNPQKNGVAKAVEHNIVQPVQHDLITPAVKVGDQIKTGVVKTYNQAKTGFNQTFTPQVGKDIVTGLKTTARYAIPAITGFAGGLAGGLATGGFGGQIAGSAGGAYLGYKIDQSLGIDKSNDMPGIPSSKIKGLGLKRGRKPKGGNLKQELQKVYDKVPQGFHEPLEDLGRAGIEYAGYKLPPKKRTPKGGNLKQELQKVYDKVPKGFHKPLEDLGKAGIEYAGFHLPPKKGKGVKGSKSKTHKGDMDYTTKKGNKDFHRGGHDETMPESDSDTENGTGMRKKKPRGMGMKKGSPEMKAHMEKLRAMRKSKVSGSGIVGNGQKDNNSPHSGAIRLSPYQNF